MQEEALIRAARALVHLAAGWRDWDDLEALARLPDGRITLDLIGGGARHDSGAAPDLRLGAALREDLAARLGRKGFALADLAEASLILGTDSRGIRTDRTRIVHFDFDFEARLRAGEVEIRETRREEHVWHARERD